MKVTSAVLLTVQKPNKLFFVNIVPNCLSINQPYPDVAFVFLNPKVSLLPFCSSFGDTMSEVNFSRTSYSYLSSMQEVASS